MSWLARLQKPRVNPQHAGLTPQPVGGTELARASDLAANDAAGTDADRWCWPHSMAMNTLELDTHAARLSRFTSKGLTLAQAEALADRLVIRDREGLDMGACLECQHCTGNRCTAPARAGLGTPGLRAFDVHPIREVLQRCSGLPVVNGGRVHQERGQQMKMGEQTGANF